MTAQSLVRAPYAILCEVLGHPQHRPPSGERVLWSVDVGGARASMREQVKAKPSVDLFDAPDALWLVTADDDAKLAIVCRDLARRVIEAASKRAGGRALRPEDKTKLNELVRQGVPLGEAMKRVRTEIVDDHARALYAWPVVETPPPGAAPKPDRARAPASPDGDGEGDEGGGDEGGEDADEIDSGDDEGGGDVSGDDDAQRALPRAARPAADKPRADDAGGELSGLARLLGALKPKPAPQPTAAQPAAVPAAKTPAAKTPAAKTPAAKKPAATPAAAKKPPSKPAAKPATKAPAKKPAAKPAAKKPDAKKKPAAKPAAKKR